MAKAEKTAVFVYGTLRRGHGNHPLISRGEFVGTARTRERHLLVTAGCPAVIVGVDHEQTAQIIGEVYRVGPQILKRLDQLEGVAHDFYRRGTFDVVLDETGEVLAAEMYYQTDPRGMTVVPSGDWSTYRRRW